MAPKSRKLRLPQLGARAKKEAAAKVEGAETRARELELQVAALQKVGLQALQASDDASSGAQLLAEATERAGRAEGEVGLLRAQLDEQTKEVEVRRTEGLATNTALADAQRKLQAAEAEAGGLRAELGGLRAAAVDLEAQPILGQKNDDVRGNAVALPPSAHYQESNEKTTASASRGSYNEMATPSIKVEPIAPSLLMADAPGITTEQSNDAQRVIQSLMDRPWADWFPKVCISYATGKRDEDAQGAGPGMLQAVAITHALYNAGIACASGLCVPVGNNWKDFLPKISSRFSRCEVLIVLLSPAFYRSQPCLLELNKSTQAKSMVILPLRCTEPLPSKDEQWLDIDQKDLSVLDQVLDKLGPINALPPRGCFFDSPSYLDDLVGRVRGVIDAVAETSAEAKAAAEAEAVQKFLATPPVGVSRRSSDPYIAGLLGEPEVARSSAAFSARNSWRAARDWALGGLREESGPSGEDSGRASGGSGAHK